MRRRLWYIDFIHNICSSSIKNKMCVEMHPYFFSIVRLFYYRISDRYSVEIKFGDILIDWYPQFFNYFVVFLIDYRCETPSYESYTLVNETISGHPPPPPPHPPTRSCPWDHGPSGQHLCFSFIRWGVVLEARTKLNM